MRAVRVHEFGGPEAVAVDEVPIPQPGDGEALVRVHAVALDPVDAKIRGGAFPGVGRDQLPVTLGHGISGTVEFCGPGVSDLQLGAAVYAFLPPGRGGAAEYALVRDGEAAPKPRTLDHMAAAAVPLAATTAWQALFDHGSLRRGQRVLVVGAAGGVGHLAVQLAKAHGAEVLAATHGQAGDAELLRELGADRVVGSEGEAGQVDLVVDATGDPEAAARWLGALRENGTFVSTVEAPDAAAAGREDVRATRFAAQPRAALLAEIARLIDEGQVRPAIERVFKLGQAVEALRFLEEGHHRGRVVLAVEEEPEDQVATPGERREAEKRPGALRLERGPA